MAGLTFLLAEKALVNLKYPLSVSDELILSKRSNVQVIKLTAGLHRQTWISGYPVFIDVHIENRSEKDVRRLDLSLEKTILFHNYSAPSSAAKLSDTLRVPDTLQREIVASTQVIDGWQSVRAMAQDFRTCQMDLPTGLVSIETGEASTRLRQCLLFQHRVPRIKIWTKSKRWLLRLNEELSNIGCRG